MSLLRGQAKFLEGKLKFAADDVLEVIDPLDVGDLGRVAEILIEETDSDALARRIEAEVPSAVGLRELIPKRDTLAWIAIALALNVAMLTTRQIDQQTEEIVRRVTDYIDQTTQGAQEPRLSNDELIEQIQQRIMQGELLPKDGRSEYPN